MRVLWVCNIALPVIAGKLGLPVSNKEGWLSGILATIQEHQEKEITLALAFPVPEDKQCFGQSVDTGRGVVRCYGFFEDVAHAETGDEALVKTMERIYADFSPEVIHCFGTEYAHSLAAVKAAKDRTRVLVGLQGLCDVYAKGFRADLPKRVWKHVTLRDFLKKDSLPQQQKKFEKRGEREREVLALAGNITGRTAFDRYYAGLWNPEASYYVMNETLREEFYQGRWPGRDYEPHTIFVSQGDYPLKGLHYALHALPDIRKAYPDVRLVVAGDNIVERRGIIGRLKSSAYDCYLRRLIRTCHLQDAVSFTGRLNAAQMKEQYLKSGLYLCCAVLENSPNSMGEAMILGMPCVTADVGGIPSLFVHNVDGKMYKGYRNAEITFYNDCYDTKEENPERKIAEGIARSVIEMFDDEKQMKIFGDNARKHAEKIHNRADNGNRLLEIYSKIAGGRKA